MRTLPTLALAFAIGIAIAVARPTFAAQLASVRVAASSRARFLEIYRDLVDTDTTYPRGSCTAAAQKMVARLRSAGLADRDIELFSVPDHPLEGGLVARLPGRRSQDKGLLLVAHLDVVGVQRDAWARDPFHLTENGGYFYGRGVSDDKAMAATLVDSFIRLHDEGFRPARPIRIALTCGEETATAFNGANYLAHERRSLIDADLAIVPSGGGRLDAEGQAVSLGVQAGEKVQQNFELLVTDKGGHSSRPVRNGAVERMSRALVKLSEFEFPLELGDVTRRYFILTAPQTEEPVRSAITALLAHPDDRDAGERVSAADPGWNAVLRTTCATTRLEAGEALNTLPQRATAVVNCRILPGHSVEEVEADLIRVIGDSSVRIAQLGTKSPTPPAPPVTPAVLGPIERVAATLWPGARVVPTLLTGATDARHFNAAGIPTYGVTAVFNDPDGDGVHAANERVRASSVDAGREFVYQLIKIYASTRGHTAP